MTLINGQPVEHVSAQDRGLLYGDGLFETLRIKDGHPCHWERHMARLAEGGRRLGIARPDESILRGEADRLCAGRGQAVLKIIVTRGAGGRGYRANSAHEPTRILSVHDWPGYPPDAQEAGVMARVCDLRLGHQPRLAGLKHLNRLENVLARSEWNDERIREGLLRDEQGAFIEGTTSNLFLVRDGALLTPALDHCGVAGVMRGLIMEQAQTAGVQVQEMAIGERVLLEADEVFLSNVLIGIWPVREVLGLRSWAPGPLTRKLQALAGGAS